MSEAVEQTPEGPTGSSRRAALKAGVGVGVGVLAWSGPTITSLGGTPAYAAGCTFVIRVNITGGCRNTDQESGCAFAYHTLDLTALPPGYTVPDPIAEGTCCGTDTSTLNFPAGVTCRVVIGFYLPPQCSLATLIGTTVSGPESDGSLVVDFSCPPFSITPPTQYTITLICNTTGAAEECLN